MKFNPEQLLFEAFFDILCIFSTSLSPKLNLVSHFCTLKDFKHTDLWSPLAPLMGEIDLCAQELFCMKFNSEQILFEPFFNVLRIFGITELQSESNRPFLRFYRYWSLEPLTPLMGRSDFFVWNSISNNFYSKLFWCDAYFWQRWVPKLIQFPISLRYKSALETKDEFYEMLQKISTYLVGYCLLMYFRDEIATVISWIWVELVGIGKIQSEIWFNGMYRYFVLQF